MKKQFLTGALAVGTLAITSVLQVSPAEAVVLSCPTDFLDKNGNSISIPDFSDNVDATGMPINGGCQLGTVNNDKVSPLPLQVNTDALFGYSDWKFRGKDDEGLDFSDFEASNPISGNYDLTSLVQASWSEVMLVLKGGNGKNIRPQEYVGYLVSQDENGEWKGTWKSPFVNTNPANTPPFTSTNVSHISLYYRDENGTTPIPTPALLPGLIGMGISALRKKKQSVAIAENA